MHRRVDAHRHLVRVLTGDLLVHVEEVAVLGFHGLLPEALDGIGEVEVHAAAHLTLDTVLVALRDGRADAAALVAHVLRLPRRDVARDQVAEGRVDPLQVVVAVLLGDLPRILGAVLGPLRDPDAAVVAERLGHQRELRLRVAVHRDAGRVDLRVAGVAEVGTLAVRPPGGGHVAAHGVGGQEEDVAVAAGGEHDGVRGPGLDLAVDHVAGHDAAGTPVDQDQLDHLVAGVHLDRSGRDLTLELLVDADQQLLTRLAAGVEGALHLDAAEGPGVEQAAVLAGEGDALRDALVDDVGRHLGEPVDVGLPGAVVAALDRVVEQAVRGVVVVAVVLRRVDAALGRDGVGPARAVLVAEVEDVVAGLTQRRGRSATGEAGADDDDAELAAVRRVDQAGLELAGLPHLVDRHTLRCLGVGDVLAVDPVVVDGRGGRGGCSHQIPTPNRTASGMIMKPTNRTTATMMASTLRMRAERPLVLPPRVTKALQNPCRMCMQMSTMQTA